MMMGVPSTLPDSNIPAWLVQRRFDHAQDFRPVEQALAAHWHSGPQYVYGLASGPRYIDLMIRRRSSYGYGLAGLRALGQSCDDAGLCYDDSGSVIGTVNNGVFTAASDYTGPAPSVLTPTVPNAPSSDVLSINCPGQPGCPGYVPPSIPPAAAGQTVTGPTGQTVTLPPAGASQQQWQLAMAQLSTAGIDLAKLALIQPGTSQAGNSITRQNPGYPVSPIATNTGITARVSTGAAVAGSTVALLGLGFLALMMMGKRN